MKNNRLIKTVVTAACVTLLVGATLFAVTVQQDSAVEQTDSLDVVADKTASVGALVGGLEARLVENPNDAKGWILLARSHDHLGNEEKAWRAYSRARDLGMTDETLELKLAANMVGSLDN
jgi:cytochrome c-type biogenesis protein CcmH/NrfG